MKKRDFLFMSTIYVLLWLNLMHLSIYHHLLFFYVSLLPIVYGRKERKRGWWWRWYNGVCGERERERFLEVELSVGERMHLCTLVGFC